MTRKLHRKEGVALQYDERFGAIECILFVSGDPVPVIQLQRALGLTDIEMQSTLQSMDELYRREERGIQLYLTEETVQLVSNRKYTDLVLTLLQPVQSCVRDKETHIICVYILQVRSRRNSRRSEIQCHSFIRLFIESSFDVTRVFSVQR